MEILRAVLGWANPNTPPENLRLYALDVPNPRWHKGGRTVERAIIERNNGLYEGDRYLIIHLGDRFFSEANEANIIKTLQDLFGATVTDEIKGD